jgi:hypothetical protein
MSHLHESAVGDTTSLNFTTTVTSLSISATPSQTNISPCIVKDFTL